MPNTGRWMCTGLWLGVLSVAAQNGSAQVVHRGTLAATDRHLRAGEYADTYTFEGQSGRRAVIDLTSSDFDPYVIVVSPSGKQWENDDYERSHSRSRVEFVMDQTGTWRVTATSFKKEEIGAYRLLIEMSDGAPTVAAASGAPRREGGRLQAGDDTLRSGEYFDEFELQGAAGERLTVDLRAADFDPYLIVVAPGGKHFENDDYDGSEHRSLLTIELPESGRYRLLATSYRKGEDGAYELAIDRGTNGVGTAGTRTERGRLVAGDDTLRSGEYYDRYTFEGRPGQHVRLDLAATGFDGYLILVPPVGEQRENDDVEGRPGHSVIDADLTESGTYKVLVTTYQTRDAGTYQLDIELRDGSPNEARQRDVQTIAFGAAAQGQLEGGDQRLRGGEYRDLYVFNGNAGDSISIELTSSEFDPYLILGPPEGGGESIQNDDAGERRDLSRIDIRLRTTGRYRIAATSYQRDETGGYQLRLGRATASATVAVPGARAAAPPATTRASSRGSSGRVYGLFVGISDYGGRATTLRYTADDARRMAQALGEGGRMRPEDAVILTDREATAAAVRDAIRRLGQRAGPNDLFFLFFSGHGGRIERSVFQSADPDGRDETIELYDSAITDDEMNALLGSVHAGASLLTLDACFSGGFSKDVISAPGRMGLFSSEEDVTSGVAVKFRAGGYLAQFMSEAIGERLADDDHDNTITALELSQYLHERYRSDVKSTSSDDYVRTSGPQTGYQHLVVDRGSIGPYDVLFR